jgi:two-component sensor histidine kinase
MTRSSLPGPLLWLGLLLLSFASRAEPIYPLLGPAALGRLRTQLRQSRPDTSRVKLLLQLSADILERSEELNTDFRPALVYCQRAQALSETLHFAQGRIGSWYALGQYHTLALDTAGRSLLRQGIRLSQQLHRRPLEALGWCRLGNSYPRVAHDLPRSLACYQRASSLFQQTGARREAAYMLKAMADIHLLQGNSGLAERELLQVAALYRAVGYPQLHYTYDLLQATKRQMGNYKEALRYGLAAIERAQATHDTSAIGIFYSRVSSLYSEVGEPQKALAYAQKALRNYQKLRNSDGIILMAGETAKVLVRLGQPQQALAFFRQATHPVSARNQLAHAQYLADLYVAAHHYPQAEQQYAKALALAEKLQMGDVYQATIYQGLGKFYLLTGRYDKARWYLQQAMAERQRSGLVLGLSRLHLLLFQVDSAQGHFPAAIAHYQQYKALNDSIFNEAKNKQLASLEIQYDTRKKEQNIALLTKQTQVQQARIRQREWQRNTLLAGAALLALLLGLGYNRYRLKQRSNQLLEAQQQEINHKNESLELLVGEKQHLLDEKQHLLEDKEGLLQEKDWMLKEIHHRVKNNLQIISSLLNTQADYLRDPAALAALRESQNRVQAMALVHQKLYQSDSVALVNMQEYIQEITERLLESFDGLGPVREQLDVAPVELDVALATPLGLILNEAITNALKHAFAPGQPGTLTISLQPIGAQRYELRIADDGVGLPAGFDVARSQSLGLTMVKGLSKQLNGVLVISSAGPGVAVTLQFEVAHKPVRAAGVSA